jgi:hypothetical protein
VGALAVQSLPVNIRVLSPRQTCQPMARLPHRRPGRPSAVAPQSGGISPPRQSRTTAAERAIRPGVLKRQGSVRTQSPAGSRVVDALMTVVATPKQPTIFSPMSPLPVREGSGESLLRPCVQHGSP